MSGFRGPSSPEDPNTGDADAREAAGPAEPHEAPPGVAGERGLPPQNAFRSVQSRVSATLTVALVSALAAGLLIWYYTTALGRGDKTRRAALAAEQQRAQGDTHLPPLGSFRASRAPAGSSSGSGVAGGDPAARDAADSTPFARLLGPPPEPPRATSAETVPAADPSPPKTPGQRAIDRRLLGPVLVPAPGDATTATAPTGALPLANYALPPSPSSPEGKPDGDSRGAPTLETLLHATPTPAVAARVLPTQRYLLPQGAFIDCTLETAISSSLPGMTTCVTATDTFGADGTVVLLERGTKLIGETRGMVQAGSPRLFVLVEPGPHAGGHCGAVGLARDR